MPRCISIHANINEHYQRDDKVVYFAFYDDERKTWHRGAITYEKLFELLKPLLAAKKDSI